MHKKTLSVVTPNYNHGKYLPQAIEAVIGQTRPPDEYIVLDDQSSDNSLSIISEYAQKCSFLRLIVNDKNMGVVKNFQRLISEASGDYIYCGAADDYILPGFFEKAMEMADLYPEAGIIFGNIVLVDENEKQMGVSDIPSWIKPEYISPQRYLHEYLEKYPINHSLSGATILRKSCLEEAGGFRPELSTWGDTFASRAIALKYGACYIPQPFMKWRVLPDSFSNKISKEFRQFFRTILKATKLMRSQKFVERFPENYVSSFEKRCRRFVLLNSLLANSGILGEYLKKIFRMLSKSSLTKPFLPPRNV
ncbi:MAG: glycosyltransferase [Candidatus Riflebacteria bacterium]|nr:glycosyltransferase [Candidatus Riflebacteria bacterium]